MNAAFSSTSKKEIVMAELLYGPTLWSRIRAQAAAVGQRRAAVAYVGQRADELISFKAGDIVVIDGSRNALRSGSTNPDTIAKWLKQALTCTPMRARSCSRAAAGCRSSGSSSRRKP